MNPRVLRLHRPAIERDSESLDWRVVTYDNPHGVSIQFAALRSIAANKHRRVALLGLSYKPVRRHRNVGDFRVLDVASLIDGLLDVQD